MDKLTAVLSDVLDQYSHTGDYYTPAHEYNRCFFDAIIYFNYPEFISNYTPLAMYQVLTEIGNHVIWGLKRHHIASDIMPYIEEKVDSAEHNVVNFQKQILSSDEQVFPHRGRLTFESNNLCKSFAKQYSHDKEAIQIVYKYVMNNMQLNYIFDDEISLVELLYKSIHLSEYDKDMLVLKMFSTQRNPYRELLSGLYVKYVTTIPSLKYLIARECVHHQSQHYSDDDTVAILLEHSREYENYHAVNQYGRPPILNNTDYEFDAEYEILVMHVENRTNIWSNTTCDQIITKNMNERTNRTSIKKYAEIREKLYNLGKITSPQCLTIANNSSDFSISCVINNNETILLPHERLVMKDLRTRNISRVNLSVRLIETDTVMHQTESIETNIYVAIYGSLLSPKFSIYFEPDASEDTTNPTSEMVRKVADVLQHEYIIERNHYPSLTLEDFIKGLGCDVINNYETRFTRNLNCTMRPIQLEKAIKIILGD